MCDYRTRKFNTMKSFMSLLLCIKFERANNWHLMETHARYGRNLPLSCFCFPSRRALSDHSRDPGFGSAPSQVTHSLKAVPVTSFLLMLAVPFPSHLPLSCELDTINLTPSFQDSQSHCSPLLRKRAGVLELFPLLSASLIPIWKLTAFLPLPVITLPS